MDLPIKVTVLIRFMSIERWSNMIFYKILKVFNNRLFSLNAEEDQILLLVEGKTPYRCVEYKPNHWTLGLHHRYTPSDIEGRLFIYNRSEEAVDEFVYQKQLKYDVQMWECEAENPERLLPAYPSISVFLSDAVKLTNRIY